MGAGHARGEPPLPRRAGRARAGSLTVRPARGICATAASATGRLQPDLLPAHRDHQNPALRKRRLATTRYFLRERRPALPVGGGTRRPLSNASTLPGAPPRSRRLQLWRAVRARAGTGRHPRSRTPQPGNYQPRRRYRSRLSAFKPW